MARKPRRLTRAMVVVVLASSFLVAVLVTGARSCGACAGDRSAVESVVSFRYPLSNERSGASNSGRKRVNGGCWESL